MISMFEVLEGAVSGCIVDSELPVVPIGTVDVYTCTHPVGMVDQNISVCLGCGMYMGQSMTRDVTVGYHHLSTSTQRSRRRKVVEGVEIELHDSYDDSPENSMYSKILSLSSSHAYAKFPMISVLRFTDPDSPPPRASASASAPTSASRRATASDLFRSNVRFLFSTLVETSRNAALLGGAYVFYSGEGEVAAPCPSARAKTEFGDLSARADLFLDSAIDRIYEIRKSARRCKDFTILFLVTMVVHLCLVHARPDGTLDECANTCAELNRTSAKVRLSSHERMSLVRALQFALGITCATLCRLCTESVEIANTILRQKACM